MEEKTAAKPVKPTLEIKIPQDQLSVYVRVLNSGDIGNISDITVEEEDVMALLKKNGVKYGIINEEVSDFCSSKNYFQWHKVAIGTQSYDGEDGLFTLTFDPEFKGPMEREDGTVDYRELGLIKNVYDGEILCNIVLPLEGMNGTNVFGGPIMARVGKPAAVTPGNNVALTEDKTELRATTDGCVYFKSGKVYVEEVYIVKEDVSLKTGNVQFNGSIQIAQNVLQGFKVNATKDIFVKGRVEGAELTAGGSIVIAGGITGMNTAKIEAGGDVTAKFIENATVKCGGNVNCDILLMSNIKAEKSILMKGERAAIIGGSILAGEKIFCRTLGSDMNLKQNVTVKKNWRIIEEGSDENDEDEKKEKADLAALKKKLLTAEQYVEMFDKKIKEENSLGAEKNIKALKEYMIKKSEIGAVVTSLKKTIESFKEESFTTSITCTGIIYPGVKINIDNCWMSVTEEIQNQKFYTHEGEIVLGAVLPGESG